MSYKSHLTRFASKVFCTCVKNHLNVQEINHLDAVTIGYYTQILNPNKYISIYAVYKCINLHFNMTMHVLVRALGSTYSRLIKLTNFIITQLLMVALICCTSFILDIFVLFFDNKCMIFSQKLGFTHQSPSLEGCIIFSLVYCSLQASYMSSNSHFQRCAS